MEQHIAVASQNAGQFQFARAELDRQSTLEEVGQKGQEAGPQGMTEGTELHWYTPPVTDRAQLLQGMGKVQGLLVDILHNML